MISLQSINGYLPRHPKISGLMYVALIVACCLATLFALTELVERYRARDASLEMLSRLAGQNQLSSGPAGTRDTRPPGSSFLDGQTVTVASALLQRITTIITDAEAPLSPPESCGRRAVKDGYPALPIVSRQETKVLYDIEAGLPFLFVERLNAKAHRTPAKRTTAGAARRGGLARGENNARHRKHEPGHPGGAHDTLWPGRCHLTTSDHL